MFAKRYQAHLLVVDVQEKLVPAIYDVETIVGNIARLVRYATILGVPVTFTEHMPEQIGHLIAPLREAGPEGASVLQKTAFSSWREPAIAARLQSQRQSGANQIVICGMETHVCVLQTALDLLAQNFEVLVVADAVGSRTSQNRELAVARLARAGAAVVCHEMIAFEWLERGDAPEFKDILPLLRGTPGAMSPHDRFFYQQDGTLHAVRYGPWKLFVTGELYNLEDDLAESTDVAAEHPEVVSKLRRMLGEFEADLEANSRPVGVAQNSRTIVPRPGVDGEEAYRPTLSLPAR